MRSFLLWSVGRFAGAVIGAWLGLFLLLELLPGAGGDTLALQVFGDRLAVTLPLVLLAGIVAGLLGIALAAAAVRFRGWADRLLGAVATVLGVLPPFWLGLLLVLLLSTTLKLLPTGGFVPWSAGPGGALLSLILPALALGLPHGGQLALRLRAAWGPEPSEAQLRAVRIAGMVPDKVRWSMGYRRVLPQVPQLVGGLLATLLVGAMVVENVFYLPGLGSQVLGAALAHDLPLLRASLFLLIVIAALLMLLAALVRLAVDPALRAAR